MRELSKRRIKSKFDALWDATEVSQKGAGDLCTRKSWLAPRRNDRNIYEKG
jgi:hypothetical protein